MCHFQLYFTCLCVLCILIDMHTLDGTNHVCKNLRPNGNRPCWFDMCVTFLPRNDLAHRNLGLHQAAEGRSLKYLHSSRHPDWLMRHLMQVCILPGVQRKDVACVMWLHNPAPQLIKQGHYPCTGCTGQLLIQNMK